MDAADLPPELEWEAAVWKLYTMVQTQWRYRQAVTSFTAMGVPVVMDVASGLDYNPAIALMQQWGWELDLGLELLQAIEIEMMKGKA